MDQGLAANAGIALHRLTCKLVWIVMTTIKTKMNPKRILSAVFTSNTPEA